MVKTSRESFIKVKESETDLDAISLIGETGMTPVEVKDAIVKMGGVTSTASEIDSAINFYINVKDFGANEGNIDNAIAFQSAIDYCYNNGGGTVIIPKGLYNLSCVYGKAKVNIIGSGFEATFIKQIDPTQTPLIVEYSATHGGGMIKNITYDLFTIIGSNISDLDAPAFQLTALNDYAIYYCNFKVRMKNTSTAMRMDSSSNKNNIYSNKFEVFSDYTTNTAFIMNYGVYNSFKLQALHCTKGAVIDSTIGSYYDYLISDNNIIFNGQNSKIYNLQLEPFATTVSANQYYIALNGTNNSIVNCTLTIASGSTPTTLGITSYLSWNNYNKVENFRVFGDTTAITYPIYFADTAIGILDGFYLNTNPTYKIERYINQAVNTNILDGKLQFLGRVEQITSTYNKLNTNQLYVSTTNTTPTTVTTDGLAIGYNQILVPNNSITYANFIAVARNTSTGDSATWSGKVAIKRSTNASTTVLVGVPVINLDFSDAGATWATSSSIVVSADTTYGALKFTVSGNVSTNIDWRIKIIPNTVI